MTDLKTQDQPQEFENIIQRLCDFLSTLWNNFIQSISNEPISFYDFIDKQEAFLDQRILDSQKEEGIVYQGGKLNFAIDESKNDDIVMTANLYYKNKADQWINQSMKQTIDKTLFSDWMTSKELGVLRKGETLEFDIESPHEEEEAEVK